MLIETRYVIVEKIEKGKEYSMFQYVLFDLDGTLTDPKLGITTCVQFALKSFGIEEENLDKLEPFIGPPLIESFKQFYGFSQEQAIQAQEKYRERFSVTGWSENELYPGIDKMLKTLSERGMKLAVASSKPEVFVEKILVHFGIREYFTAAVGSELDGRRINKDEVVLEALYRIGMLTKEEVEYYLTEGIIHGNGLINDHCAMVGDRKFDVEGAKAMNVTSVAVSYGYAQGEELKLAQPDYIADSVEELQRILLQ